MPCGPTLATPKIIRVLQPGARVYPHIPVVRARDGVEQARYYYGRGKWGRMVTDRKALRRMADKIAEHQGYILAHLANMHEAYKGAAETQDEAVLAMIALTEIAIELWDGVRRDL